MSYRQQIQDAIDKYAVAYNELENLQKNPQEDSKLIPEGDQKTGAIGEYYAMQYCQKKYPKKGTKISFGNHSQAGWDIEVKEPGKKSFKIQVKTVSAFAAGRKTTPIKVAIFNNVPFKITGLDLPLSIKKLLAPLDNWHQLFIIYLNKCFLPEAFWIFEPEAFRDKGEGKDKDKDKGEGKDKDKDEGEGEDKDKDEGKGKDKKKSFNLTLPKVMENGKKFVDGSAIFGTKEANKGEKPRVYKYLVNENDEHWQEVLNEARDGKGLYACLEEDEVIKEKGD
jgi:hypothetical protein